MYREVVEEFVVESVVREEIEVEEVDAAGAATNYDVIGEARYLPEDRGITFRAPPHLM